MTETVIIHRPAEPHPQPVEHTAHEMKCIGLGKPLDAELLYTVEVTHPNIVLPLKANVFASNSVHAGEKAAFSYPAPFKVTKITLL